ncbi:MAG: ATP-binding protein [Coriobacteriales bacterium]
MNPTIVQILRDFQIDDYLPIVQRDLDLGEPLTPRRGNLVKVIIGMRRSGKSYRLLQEMERLHDEGISWSRMCYFNFEDDRLGPVTPQTGDAVMEAFAEENPESLDKGAYFFFDEIQEMDGWSAWMRRMVDTQKATFYLTGSSSKLLSDEIGTEFRGRALEFELLPLSFGEYVRFHELDPSMVKTTREWAKLRKFFRTYLECGGFPDTIRLTPPLRVTLLQSYANRVAAKDVVERHEMDGLEAASQVGRRLLELNGCELSLRKMDGQLRSQGTSVARATIARLVDYFASAYLIFLLEERRIGKTAVARSRKVYAIDPGLALANAKAGSNNEGQRLEDAVYLELRRRTVGLRDGVISSYRTNRQREVDFLVGDSVLGNKPALYQVCASLDSPETRKRELRALAEAAEETSIENLYLITGSGESEEAVYDGKRIQIVPALGWFLGTAL